MFEGNPSREVFYARLSSYQPISCGHQNRDRGKAGDECKITSASRATHRKAKMILTTDVGRPVTTATSTTPLEYRNTISQAYWLVTYLCIRAVCRCVHRQCTCQTKLDCTVLDPWRDGSKAAVAPHGLESRIHAGTVTRESFLTQAGSSRKFQG